MTKDENGSIDMDDLIFDPKIRETLAGVAKDACARHRERAAPKQKRAA